METALPSYTIEVAANGFILTVLRAPLGIIAIPEMVRKVKDTLDDKEPWEMHTSYPDPEDLDFELPPPAFEKYVFTNLSELQGYLKLELED